MKVRRLAAAIEEQKAKTDPNRFILSAVSSEAAAVVNPASSSSSSSCGEAQEKLNRNNAKLLQAASSFKTFHEAAVKSVEALLLQRNVVIASIIRAFATPFNENPTIQPLNHQHMAAGSSMKFESSNSQEQESLEKEIAIRQLLNIPVGMNLPVIRKKSIQIDDKEKDDYKQKKKYSSQSNSHPIPAAAQPKSTTECKEDPIPFTASDPSII